MTVVKETTIHRYIGLAADAKPTSVPAGSTFLAHDTDEIYITHDGGTTWVLKDTLVRLVAGTAAIGKLAANSGVDIGDVDVTSIAFVLNIGANQDGIAANSALAVDSGGSSRMLHVAPSLAPPGASTWDRARSIASSGAGLGVQQVGTLGELITLAASAARTAGANGTAVTGLGWRNRYIILCDITASATDAADTLDVYIDVSLDGTTWLNAVHFTQQAGNGAARKEFAVLDPSAPGTAVINVTADAAAAVVRPSMFGPQMRARWAIVDAGGAANQSHTFSVVAYAI